jgi:ParB-like chromosome segregation protein Spo0J
MPTIDLKEIIVLKEHREYLPPLNEEERNNLEADIKENGITSPLILMKGTKYLLDGHNRRDIARKLGISKVPYEVRDTNNAEEWILRYQLSRRNLTEIQRDKLMAELVKKAKTPAKEKKVIKELAKENKVSETTVKRAVKQQEAIEKLPEKAKKKIEEKGTRREANKQIQKHNPHADLQWLRNEIWELKNALTNIETKAANLDEEEMFKKDSAVKRLAKVVDFQRMNAMTAWLDEKIKEVDSELKTSIAKENKKKGG